VFGRVEPVCSACDVSFRALGGVTPRCRGGTQRFLRVIESFLRVVQRFLPGLQSFLRGVQRLLRWPPKKRGVVVLRSRVLHDRNKLLPVVDFPGMTVFVTLIPYNLAKLFKKPHDLRL